MSKNIFLMKKLYTLFLLLVSIQFCLNVKKSLVLPYKIYYPPENDQVTKEQIYSTIERNYMYTVFEVGNPKQKIPVFFNFNDSDITFHSDYNLLLYLNSTYSPSTSQSFNITGKKTAIEDLYFNIDNELLKKTLKLVYPDLDKDHLYYYISAGLQNFYKSNRKKKVKSPNFLYQLKNLGIIDYISFSINQTSETGGFLNINLEPHEYAPQLYNTDNRHISFVKGVESISINTVVGEFVWNLDLSYAEYKNKEHQKVNIIIEHYELNEDQYSTLLNPTYGLIKGPFEFKNLIKKDFFNEFILKNICTQSLANKLSFYSCDAKYKKQLKAKFPPITFYLPELKYTFVLEFDDLFFERNGILFFLICYDNAIYGETKYSQISEWVFGKPFFNKYQFSFDVEKNVLTFYKNDNKTYTPEKVKYKKMKEVLAEFNIKDLNSNNNDYIEKIMPTQNLFLISLSLLIIFISFFCLVYKFRVKNKKSNNLDISIDEGKKCMELKENLENN